MAYPTCPTSPDAKVFAVEFLPGQFDQRADSASRMHPAHLPGRAPRPSAPPSCTALEGDLTDADVDAIKHYVINPVEAREATPGDARETAERPQAPVPGKVETIDGFNEMDAAAGQQFIDERGLAMDLADLEFCQTYFRDARSRDPTITEIKVIDTYWSDHCRHTTFGTELDERDRSTTTRSSAAFEQLPGMRARARPRGRSPSALMDMGTIGAKWLKKQAASSRTSTSPRRSTPAPSRSRST